MICEVLSRVDVKGELFRDVCFEWEEELAKYFNVPVRKILPPVPQAAKMSMSRRIKNFIKKILPVTVKIKRLLTAFNSKPAKYKLLTQNLNLPLSLCFVMFPFELAVFENDNCIPIFLDIWTDEQILEVAERTRELKLFYVTSIDVFNRIKAANPSSQVKYMPLSIADKYYSRDFVSYRNKKIDVIHSSRRNPILHEYMLRYISEHGNISYMYREGSIYQSADGKIIGRAPDRQSYMNNIASAKVCLVCCSGIDNVRDDTNGIQFPTPRFYEAVVQGCALIGRYPENQEFTELNMSRYCPNITSYEQFCECLERALAQTPEELYTQNHDFIINSLTSKRAEQIKHDLEEILRHE